MTDKSFDDQLSESVIRLPISIESFKTHLALQLDFFIANQRAKYNSHPPLKQYSDHLKDFFNYLETKETP